MGDVNSWYGRVADVRSWMFDEGSWRRSSRGDTARCLMRVAVGWVVKWSWMIVAGSWGRSSRRMQLGDRCGYLRSVVVGKSMSRFWQYVGLTGGVSIWLLQRVVHRLVVAMLEQSVTVSRTWTGCCIAGASWSKSVLAAWPRRVERAGD